MRELDVIYCGDHWPNRAKTSGLLLTEQAMLSIQSLRENWSNDVRVLFLHTQDLPQRVKKQLEQLNVKLVRCTRSIEPNHLMANKILPIHIANKNADQLFLDCDTIIHKPIPLKREAEVQLAFDALFPMPIEIYEKAFALRELEVPVGKIYSSPAKEFYLLDDTKQFPAWNAGVHYLNKRIRKKFYKCYLRSFRQLYESFSNSRYEFYIETLAFTTTVFELGLNVEYFSKGINFICTPRADALADWPRSEIIVEHYAGNTSAPLQFDGERIIRSWADGDK